MARALFTLAFICLAATPSFSADTAKQVLRFRVAHGPYQILKEPMESFKRQVEAGTQGRVTVEIKIPAREDNSSKGAERAMKEVASGKFEMTQIYTHVIGRRVASFNVLDVPFMFRDHDHAFAVVDGQIGKELFTQLENQTDLVGLAFTYCGGHRFVGTREKEIHKLEDLRGLRFANAHPIQSHFFKKLGATSDSINKFESSQAILDRKFDALNLPYPRYTSLPNQMKAAPVVNTFHESIQFTSIIMNKKVFARLSPADREVIQKAATASASMERKAAIEIEYDVLKNPSKFGVRIVNVPDSELKKAADISAGMDWKQFGVSAELIRRVKSEGLSAPKQAAN